MSVDGIVVAGGSARRLGGLDKGSIEVGGRTLLEHAVSSLATAGARRIVVVGKDRMREGIGLDEPNDGPRLSWTSEEPPGSGPLAGLLAGLGALAASAASAGDPAGRDSIVLVSAVDTPFAGPVFRRLLAALDASAGADGAMAVDEDGRLQHLLAAYRRRPLDRAAAALGSAADEPMRLLVERLSLVHVRATTAETADCDDASALERLRLMASLGGRRAGDVP